MAGVGRPTARLPRLHRDSTAGPNDWDGAAYLDLVTENATFRNGLATTPAAEQATFIDSLGAVNWHVEPIGDAIMTGDGPWYVAIADHLTADTYPEEGYEGLSIVTIIDEGGTLLISNHTYIGPS